MRLIPASAGSTSPPETTTSHTWAHPRVCGEHPSRCRCPRSHHGSSPRLRGAPSRPGRRRAPTRAHPRVCGEHVSMCISSCPSMGSSPRLRGALMSIAETITVCGLIPASAGSTGAASESSGSAQAHPRVCGEHTSIRALFRLLQGSSPRLRGAPPRGAEAGRPTRLIPASAGSTAARS